MATLCPWATRAAFVTAALVVAAAGFRDLQHGTSGGQGPGVHLRDVVTAAVRSGDTDEGLKVLLLGGLLTDPRAEQYCKSKCNGERFYGGECQGKLVTKCTGQVTIDDSATVFIGDKQKCLGTFTASSDGQVNCVGLFNRKGGGSAYMEEGGFGQMTALFCGVQYNARVAFTESPFAFHMEETCEGGVKYRIADGAVQPPSNWSGLWEQLEAFDDSIEWPESWNDDYFGMQAEPSGHKSSERDCSQGCQDSFPAPTCDGLPSDLSAECHGIFNFSYSSWESTITKLCDGCRSPMGTFVDDSLDVYSTCNGTGTHQRSFSAGCGIVANEEVVCKGILFREVVDIQQGGDMPVHIMGELGFCDGLQTIVTDVTASGDGMNGDELKKKTMAITV